MPIKDGLLIFDSRTVYRTNIPLYNFRIFWQCQTGTPRKIEGKIEEKKLLKESHVEYHPVNLAILDGKSFVFPANAFGALFRFSHNCETLIVRVLNMALSKQTTCAKTRCCPVCVKRDL